MLFRLSFCLLTLFGSLQTAGLAQDTVNFPVIGEVISMDPAFEQIIDPRSQVQVVASGFLWSEGPVWVQELNAPGYLLFSDIPRNSIMKWVEGQGVSLFMKPSGYTGVAEYGVEPGSNGLVLDLQGQLICCEHGDRRVSVLTKGGGKRTLVDNYRGKRLNSPNDAVVKSNGDIYFTDPPYGLPKQLNDPLCELEFCGVYRLSTDGTVTLLTNQMTRPNGLAFSPDESVLYVAQSDPSAALWMAYPVQSDGTLAQGTVMYDATNAVTTLPGLPDGLTVDKFGNIFATGPGGVYVFSRAGKLLGRISTGERTANCKFGGPDGTTLYMTADMYLCRIPTKTGK
ncbi:SMP-30/gluconolactonase/LRE family protein [Planctomicrobium piriforme]|uniref:Gluconolactonase n=1 Tax=Planctomicrobium piriforme TaxID=1576369 RepID=A0A1I3EPR5_9PLAN|nr:SMP-30/gluconolactonase/LRE family protein [Planctomicrobium piriforme]SFI00681.1 gluconolactonase [Planctomicrobium piriforme]